LPHFVFLFVCFSPYFFSFIIFTFTYMCIHCLGHLPSPPALSLSHPPILNWVFCCWVIKVLHIFWTLIHLLDKICEYFLPFHRLLFHSVDSVLCCTKLFFFLEVLGFELRPLPLWHPVPLCFSYLFWHPLKWVDLIGGDTESIVEQRPKTRLWQDFRLGLL
jgi:hypothetical protein